MNRLLWTHDSEIAVIGRSIASNGWRQSGVIVVNFLSDRGPAAIDGEDLVGHVAAGVAGQEQQGAVKLPFAPSPAQRRASRHPLLAPALLGEHVLGHLRLEPPRGQRVDPDPLARPLRRQLAGQGDYPSLRSGVSSLRDLTY